MGVIPLAGLKVLKKPNWAGPAQLTTQRNQSTQAYLLNRQLHDQSPQEASVDQLLWYECYFWLASLA